MSRRTSQPRALISVTDKTGVAEFARALTERGFTILSTGGTFEVLRAAGVPAVEVSAHTGFPEMMAGRVKTLHPKVHGGILARREDAGDLEAMAAFGIDPIDVVAVNLYRFREAARAGQSREAVIENIDIGGPALIRSAAKNHRHVLVVVDPADYGAVVAAVGESDDSRAELGRRLAAKAFAHTADYDRAIADWFAAEGAQAEGATATWRGVKAFDLRYGENPHQRAALYRDPESAPPSLAHAEQLNGKELGYNNLLDLDAALRVVAEFEAPAAVVVKHDNPCGAAVAATATDAFLAALAADAVSAYGGILAFNVRLDAACAAAIVESATFVEAIVAPHVEPAALEVLRGARWGANVRVLALGGMPGAPARPALRTISGGYLAQDADAPVPVPAGTVATRRTPSAGERSALEFAWRVVKHVKSNAIVLARADGSAAVTVGIGAGQTSRVDAVQIALRKAGESARGAVLASDAFFPFADGVEAAARSGVRAVIQPGGSRRDAEVIAAADGADMAMVFTGMRHFRH